MRVRNLVRFAIAISLGSAVACGDDDSNIVAGDAGPNSDSGNENDAASADGGALDGAPVDGATPMDLQAVLDEAGTGLVQLVSGTYAGGIVEIRAGTQVVGSESGSTVLQVESLHVTPGNAEVSVRNVTIVTTSTSPAIDIDGTGDDAESVVLSNISVHLAEGVALQVVNLENLEVGGLQVAGEIPVDNVTGITIDRVGSPGNPAEISDVDIAGFGPWGYLTMNSYTELSNASFSNLKESAIGVYGSSELTIEGAEIDVPNLGRDNPIIIGAVGTTVRASEVTITNQSLAMDPPTIFHYGSTLVDYTNLQISLQGVKGFWVQDSAQVRISGTSSITGAKGAAAVFINVDDVGIDGLTVDTVSGTDPVQDGIELTRVPVASLSNVSSSNAQRAALLITVEDQADLAMYSFANVSVDALSTGFGAVAQTTSMTLLDPDDWGAGIARDSDAMTRDRMAFVYLTPMAAITATDP